MRFERIFPPFPFRPIGTGSIEGENVFFSRIKRCLFLFVERERGSKRSSTTFQDPPEKNILKFIYLRKFFPSLSRTHNSIKIRD